MKLTKRWKRKLRNEALAAMAIVIPLVVSGCLDNTGKAGVGATSSSSKSNATAVATNATTTFTIFKGVVTAPTATATATATATPTATPTAAATSSEIMTLFLQTLPTTTLNNFCDVQTGTPDGRGCLCQYSWNETNTASSQVIQRMVSTSPTQITAFQIQCPVPNVYDSEIPDGTVIGIQFVPDTVNGNVNSFSTNSLAFTKEPVTNTGDFQDVEGDEFKNIYHYSCFDISSKNLSIDHNKKTPNTSSTATSPPLVKIANDFVLGNAGYTGQSYYYDFFIRSNEIGNINITNGSFYCPQTLINGAASFYPMDSQFALGLNTTTQFPVPVAATSVVPIDTNTAGSNGVLGYAAQVNGDGSCPAITDTSGKVRPTFRLRRFKTVYPLRFNADGDVFEQNQKFNVVYVLDRPVNKLTQDPLKPITRIGPKPCPFSFATAQFGQVCSVDSTLVGHNVDGTQIPGDPGCPTYPPPPSKYIGADGSIVIRPYKVFQPYYSEDTTFQACAPQSSTPQDPEILVVHDDNAFPLPLGPNDFYCARDYAPTGAILPPPGGSTLSKPPGDCSDAVVASAIKTNQMYSCLREFDTNSSAPLAPAAGCCQICSGTDCTAQGGGVTPAGRNAAFSPPQDSGNPASGFKRLPRAVPNQTGGGGCFDSNEDTAP